MFQIAAEVSAPLAKTDEIVLIGGQDRTTSEVSKLVGTLPPAVQALTGVDITGVGSHSSLDPRHSLLASEFLLDKARCPGACAPPGPGPRGACAPRGDLAAPQRPGQGPQPAPGQAGLLPHALTLARGSRRVGAGVGDMMDQLRPLIGAVYLKRGVFLFIQFISLPPSSSQLK